MAFVVVNWLTAADITSKDIAEQFIASMKACIPDHLPVVCGDIEPLSVAFDNTNQVSCLWREGFYWQGRESRRKRDYDISGGVFLGFCWHTTIIHRYKAKCPISEDPIRFLWETSKLLMVDYAYAHVFGEADVSPEDELLKGLTSHELQASLPTIPWACCFGPPYVKMIGRKRIAAAPFWKVDEIESERLLCQAVNDPSECTRTEYNEKREAIKAAIGVEYVFDPTDPQKKAVVPQFAYLRKRTSGE